MQNNIQSMDAEYATYLFSGEKLQGETYNTLKGKLI